MSLRSLTIITHGYPCNANPVLYTFVQQFAGAVARTGVVTRVVAPIPLHVAWRGRDALRQEEDTGGGGVLDLWRPRYLSLSNAQFGRWNTSLIGQRSFIQAVGRVLRHQGLAVPDALYGHFLYRGGQAAVHWGKQLGVPAFPMVGEGLLNSMDAFGHDRARCDFARATAFMANSTCLGGLLRRELGVPCERIGVFPNGVNHGLFYPRDKAAMRRKLRLSDDRFLVICVGSFDIAKGPLRVGQAIRSLAGVGGIFIGAGSHPPEADTVLFRGRVRHSDVPDWLSAADVFVLPTEWEGCCNAILEAMACGLPVISSKGEFNDDILNSQVAIRVDPMDVQAIRRAILTLQNDAQLRTQMARAALLWSQRFDVDRRAATMLEFMASKRT